MCILLVEDEPLLRTLIEDVLHDAGHEVIAAHNVPQAMKALNEHPGHFTCLVTDLQMPHGPTGADLIEHMRQSYLSMPIVLATASPSGTTSDWRQKFRVRLLNKPYGSSDMLELVERLLNTSAPLNGEG